MSQAEITLFDCEYFPCMAWYASFLKAKNPYIEQYEYFERSSYRNRCEVIGPNGKITLSIPLERGRNQRTVMKDLRICNKEKWHVLHWKTLCASYRRAPFFEYYEEELRPFFEKEYTYLFDLNLDSIALLNKLLKVEKPFSLTEQYEKNLADCDDFRRAFSPKQTSNLHLPVYMQNFEERHGFIQNLSMLDMLFSCGHRATALFEGLA